MPMYTLGHDFVPPPVHAGGLRYHGDSPAVCALVKEGIIEPFAIQQTEPRVRGGGPVRARRGAPPRAEPAHAIRVAIDQAEEAKRAGDERVILINLSGHGHFDMSAYDAYLAGSSRTWSSPERLDMRRSSGCRTPRRWRADSPPTLAR